MGIFKNDVGRPSNKTIIVRNILKGIAFVVVCIALIAGGYFLNGYQNKTNDNNTIEKEELTKKEVEEIISNIFTVDEYSDFDYWLYLYDSNKKIFNINSKKFKLNIALGKTKEIKNKYSCDELFKNRKLTSYFSGENLDDLNLRCESNSRQYLYEDVNATFKELFGSKLFAPKESIQIYSLPYAYVSEKNVYVELLFDTGDAPYFSISGIVDYRTEKNKLYVTYGIARLEDGVNLKLSDGTLVEAKWETYENYENSREKYFDMYKDKLFKYELTFDLENNNYVFKSLNKLK